MSIIFTSPEDDPHKDIKVFLLNRDKKQIINPLEDLDEEEKIAVLVDILNSQPVQNTVKIGEQKWTKSSEVFIGHFPCQKFGLSIILDLKYQKRGPLQSNIDDLNSNGDLFGLQEDIEPYVNKK